MKWKQKLIFPAAFCYSGNWKRHRSIKWAPVRVRWVGPGGEGAALLRRLAVAIGLNAGESMRNSPVVEPVQDQNRCPTFQCRESPALLLLFFFLIFFFQFIFGWFLFRLFHCKNSEQNPCPKIKKIKKIICMLINMYNVWL